MTEPEQKSEGFSFSAFFGQIGSGLKSVFDAIIGLFKSVFEAFFPKTNTSNETPDSPDRPARKDGGARVGTLEISKSAVPHWQKFMEETAGEKVEFTNPLQGGFKEITRDMRKHFHPIHKEMRMHDGVDLAPLKPDAKILASADGVVLFAGEKRSRDGKTGGYGNTIIIGHGKGKWTAYAHLRDKPDANMVGARVKSGQPIGIVGNSGDSTAVHLHYEQGSGDDRVLPRIAEVGELKSGVEYAARDKLNPFAAYVERDKGDKYPVQAEAKVPEGRKTTFMAHKLDPHTGHTHG